MIETGEAEMIPEREDQETTDHILAPDQDQETKFKFKPPNCSQNPNVIPKSSIAASALVAPYCHLLPQFVERTLS